MFFKYQPISMDPSFWANNKKIKTKKKKTIFTWEQTKKEISKNFYVANNQTADNILEIYIYIYIYIWEGKSSTKLWLINIGLRMRKLFPGSLGLQKTWKTYRISFIWFCFLMNINIFPHLSEDLLMDKANEALSVTDEADDVSYSEKIYIDHMTWRNNLSEALLHGFAGELEIEINFRLIFEK